LVRAAEYEETAATELAERLQDKLTKMGKDSGRSVLDPNKHFFQDQLDGIFSYWEYWALSLILGLLWSTQRQPSDLAGRSVGMKVSASSGGCSCSPFITAWH
jgi:hypothetical protein